MDKDCEIIEFKVPYEADRILVVHDVISGTENLEIKHFFESFGLVYEAQVTGEDGYHRQGTRTFVKFYSGVAAHRAMMMCNSGLALFKGQLLSCKAYKKDRKDTGYMTVPACIDLANKTLGFDNWNMKVNYCRRVSNDSFVDDPFTITFESSVDIRMQTSKLHVSTGIAQARTTDRDNCGAHYSRLECIKKTCQSAVRYAKLAAFQDILLAVFPSGKTEVVVKNLVTRKEESCQENTTPTRLDMTRASADYSDNSTIYDVSSPVNIPHRTASEGIKDMEESVNGDRTESALTYDSWGGVEDDYHFTDQDVVILEVDVLAQERRAILCSKKATKSGDRFSENSVGMSDDILPEEEDETYFDDDDQLWDKGLDVADLAQCDVTPEEEDGVTLLEECESEGVYDEHLNFDIDCEDY
eukprot:CFRG2958T1